MASTSIAYTDQNDTELLTAVLSHAERAWEEFLRRYRGLIYRCIGKVTAKYSAVVDREDVDEIFADVCLNLVRDDMHKLRAYRADRGSKLGSWVGLIAINTAYDYLRGLARQPRLERLDSTPDVATGALSPLELLCEQERWVRLNHFVCSFSPRDRRFLELYYANGLEPEEIAVEMGISIKTVYSKKNKVLSRLTRMARGGDASLAALPMAEVEHEHEHELDSLPAARRRRAAAMAAKAKSAPTAINARRRPAPAPAHAHDEALSAAA